MSTIFATALQIVGANFTKALEIWSAAVISKSEGSTQSQAKNVQDRGKVKLTKKTPKKLGTKVIRTV